MSKSVLERPLTKRKILATEPSHAVEGSARVLWFPVIAIAVLAALPVLTPRIGENPELSATLWAVAGALLVFLLLLWRRVRKNHRTLQYEAKLIQTHYVQLVMHSSIYAYWGWYWRDVYRFVPLLIAQIAFVYAFDMLVCWSRRDKWALGFGPIPIVLSTNLFLWFRDDWFYWQFVMLAVGVLGKEFIKWKRDGRLTHIFNPSALSLFLFSVVLIATKNTDMTWGIEIAATLHRPPHIYLEIFILGLIVQGFFGVTLVTLWSAAALFALNLLYTRVTGDYNFIDSNIPVAVFLGLHLLVTDPATSPRKGLGKAIFGAMYGAGVFGMYRLLTLIGAPEFYDKLLCVPLLNLFVRQLDRFSVFVSEKLSSIGWKTFLRPRPANFGWMGVWVAFFTFMVSTGFLGKGKDHPGGNPEHWRQACLSGSHKGCETWVRTLNIDCQDGSATACATLAPILNEGRLVNRNAAMAGLAFARACDLGITANCGKLIGFVRADGKDKLSQACREGDGAACFVLGSLYSGGNGVEQNPTLAFNFFEKSCNLRWWRGCGRLGVSYLVGQGAPEDSSKAMENFEKGCRGENGASCFEAGKLYSTYFSAKDRELAQKRFESACEFGVKEACQQVRAEH